EQPYDGPRIDFRETIFWNPSVRTGEGGEAQVQLFLSDAVTTFRVFAEGLGGGQGGRGEAVIASKLPVVLAARLPQEVSTGDTLELPITVTNATSKARKARLVTSLGKAFVLSGPTPPTELDLRGGEGQTIFVPLRVVGSGRDEKEGALEVTVESGNLRDVLARTVRIVPGGFPQEKSASGKLRGGSARHEIDLPESLAGSLLATLEVYPSPTATLLAGMEAMLQEPSGCFEQASSSNYPNVMVLSYLATQPKTDPAVVSHATQLLARGYKRLTGYESKSKGFEWFGEDPGHEALTAYGVVQFTDMAKVFPDVDRGMIQRTVAWLKARRDGKGGYQRNSKALDSFGQASEETTNIYITHAIAEAGEAKDFAQEIEATRKLASSTRDPYLLALAADTLVLVEPDAPDTLEALRKLASLQAQDGSFPGARESITRSGGIALAVETTALAALALQRSPEHSAASTRALNWIARQRNGAGGFGSTQATVLALKALTRGASGFPSEGSLTVTINGGAPLILKLAGVQRPSLTKLEGQLRKGKNIIEVKGPDGVEYGFSIKYRTDYPNKGKPQVELEVSGPRSARLGEGVKLMATVMNKSNAGLPMVLVRVGIPGGLIYQTWQLDELKARRVIDFYETREREVILYFRGMAPKAKVEVPIQLLATVPGRYTSPASQAYLYYTDEHRSMVAPRIFTVNR
ncbi:MAG: alpha-2-macroglobulin family protein, partial [Myxococcales bacterium]|nr:hypothetical protein [Polyangiaceae bacterium]MDW8250035.1 alpha-2-macroglobulin family protein [Myxococcales bacterium]